MITIRSSDELARLEQASRVVLETLEVLKKAVAPGVTTEDLDRIAAEEIRRRTARPAVLNYRGFPKTNRRRSTTRSSTGFRGPDL